MIGIPLPHPFSIQRFARQKYFGVALHCDFKWSNNFELKTQQRFECGNLLKSIRDKSFYLSTRSEELGVIRWAAVEDLTCWG